MIIFQIHIQHTIGSIHFTIPFFHKAITIICIMFNCIRIFTGRYLQTVRTTGYTPLVSLRNKIGIPRIKFVSIDGRIDKIQFHIEQIQSLCIINETLFRLVQLDFHTRLRSIMPIDFVFSGKKINDSCSVRLPRCLPSFRTSIIRKRNIPYRLIFFFCRIIHIDKSDILATLYNCFFIATKIKCLFYI